MAIDLRNVEPLASKSRLHGNSGALLGQALKQTATRNSGASRYHKDMLEDDDMTRDSYFAPQVARSSDLQWIQEDKEALQTLVQQMDATMGDLSRQLQQVKVQALQSRSDIEKEQQLLFKQIHTLNGLMKKQVTIFSAMEKQMHLMDIKRGPVLQNAAVGVIAGLVSAVTLVALTPVAMSVMQSMMAG